jgi:hypothetical protein
MPISRKSFYTIVAGCILALVVPPLWGPVKTFILQDSCLDHGGKWATNGNYCIFRECGEDGSCRPSYNNKAVCLTLESGINRETLFFHLGMPESNDGIVYTFSGGGGSGSPIKATVVNGIVSEIECGN